MKLEVNVLYEVKYKTPDHFDEALERWVGNDWVIADVVNSLEENTNAAIIYRIINQATP